ncbi:MAG: MFS transporter [Candidatus Nealsonbacteria bacterium]|nr:MFS transporter [Candidatus Nealsonbacteria bacterium]
MLFYYNPIQFLHYLLRRDATQFFTSIAIRYFAFGMILIFEPIYLYFYFDKSISSTLLFFAALYGLYGLIVVYGGKIMAKVGLRQVMLLSYFFFFGYYLCLFFLYQSFLLVPLAIVLGSFGMMFFWPAFHTDFIRFSEKDYQGRSVGKMNIACSVPTIFSPIIGGWILSSFNYPVLFIVVLIVLFTSTIPLFLSKEVHIIYSDSYQLAWKRIFKKANRKINIGFIVDGIETGINAYLWPIFMVILAISYETMGGIITFALGISALFTLYIGKLSDRIINRIKVLNIGSVLTSLSWLVKFFVATPFSAFLAHAFYAVCRTTASIPFQTLLYERASGKGAETDEFIVYREIIINISRSIFFIALAGFFFFVPQINLAFILAAIFSLGFMFLGVPPKIFKKPK